jgi:DnaB-like helicase C terminal domain/Pretoxin HINT domain
MSKKLIRLVTEKIKIRDLFSKLEIRDKENEHLEPKFPIRVKTPYGYNLIKTAFRTEKQPVVTSYFGNNKTLRTSGKHLLRVSGEWKKVDDIAVGEQVEIEGGTTKLVSKKLKKSRESLYDISVEDVHCYYSNGIVSHNSWFLARLGAEAMRQGKNVLHFTLELNESYVGLRYDSIFTGIDFQDIRKNVGAVKAAFEHIPGKLKIKYFPSGCVNSYQLKTHIERTSALGYKIDMVIVDYADILSPIKSDRNGSSYNDAGTIYTDLRSVAGELQIPIWSASQANRAAMKEAIVTSDHIADSIKKLNISDFIMSVSRKPEDKAANTARCHIIKNRMGPDGMTFPARMNASRGDIQLFDENSREGIALMQEMANGENKMKQLLKEKWEEEKKNQADDMYS